MLGLESETRLKRLIVCVGDGEKDLEGCRQRLCQIRDFAPHSGFQRIDRDSNGWITSFELLQFIRDHGNYAATESECYRLVKFFDSDEDGRLCFNDFVQMILPCEENTLRNVALDRPSFKVGRHDGLPRDIEVGMAEIFDRELDLVRRQDILKHDCHVRYDFTLNAAYRSIDRYNDGRIDSNNLSAFLRSCGHYMTERELLQVLRRIDTDGDARLSFSEFSEFFSMEGAPMPEPRPVEVVEEPPRLAPRQGRSNSPLRQKNSPRRSPIRETLRSELEQQRLEAVIHEPIHHPVPIHPPQFHEHPGMPYPYPPPPYMHHPCQPPPYHAHPCQPMPCHPPPELRQPVHFVSSCQPPQSELPKRHHEEPVRRAVVVSPSRQVPAQKPLLHVPEEDHLISSLKEMCNLEQELEHAKTALTMKADFNLLDQFSIFDPSRRGVIGVNDIREGLSAIGVYPTGEEIELFMTRYDKNGDRRLNFNEFAEAYCPIDGYYAHLLNRRQSNGRTPLYRRDDCFLQDTQLEHRNVWRVHFKVECDVEAIRQRLAKIPCFNVFEAFNSMDLNDSGNIDPSEVRRMLESRGFSVSGKEVNDLMHKFDSNKSGRITYSEFRDEILPKSPVSH